MNSVEQSTLNIPTRVFLVGPMGAGKTTIGMPLAKSLAKKFYDCDKEIELRTGANIPLIFELEGEAGFRKRETLMLAEMSQLDDIVLATGGGVVLLEENRQLLKERGFVVYLTAPLDQLYQRTNKDRDRPLLLTKDPRAKIAQLLAQRTLFYEEIADLMVDTGSKNVKEVVSLIVQTLNDSSL